MFTINPRSIMLSKAFRGVERILLFGEYPATAKEFFKLFDRLTPPERDLAHKMRCFLIGSSEFSASTEHRLLYGRLRCRCSRPRGYRIPSQYVAAVERAIFLHPPQSALPYSCLCVDGIADRLKQQGVSIRPDKIPVLLNSVGCRLHPHVDLPPGIESVDPDFQFRFVGRRLETIVNRSQVALFISADVVGKQPVKRSKKYLGWLVADHVRAVLGYRFPGFNASKLDELLLIVEGGGLLGLHNERLPNLLDWFAGKRNISSSQKRFPWKKMILTNPKAFC